jgi:hypothetical protein
MIVASWCRRRDVETCAWGKRTIRFARCRRCGCTVLHERTKNPRGSTLGINVRNFDPLAIAKVRVRRFDGAKTRKYLD